MTEPMMAAPVALAGSGVKHPGVSAPLRESFPWLDGLRGTAALWVLLSHVQILSGLRRIPVLSWGGLAVDLFMMLSGLLMAHHYLLRQASEPWADPRTWFVFWTRRFFRIAPLYYLLLAVAIALAPWLGQARDAVAMAWPAAGTEAARYAGFDLANLIAHLSFTFGALPSYAFRTPLPDWSIGLEMQFYLFFPFAMLMIQRFGLLAAGIAMALAGFALQWQFAEFFGGFSMPSFLPLKLHVFVIGIWIAVSRARGAMRWPLAVSAALTLAEALHVGSFEAAGRVLLVVALFYVMSDGSLPAPAPVLRGLARLRAAFSGRVCRFVGDASYGLYLVHLLVLIPVAGFLAQVPAYVEAPAGVRFALCLFGAAPISLLLAWLGHRAVEMPGIRLGKGIVRRCTSAPVSAGETSAATR